MKKIASLVSLAVIAAIYPTKTFASETLADTLMKGNKLVAVVVVLAIILSGILIFLWSLEKRIRKMENDVNQ